MNETILIYFWLALPFAHAWMLWNLFLAILPLGLSFALFRLSPTRSPLWWLGLLAFIALLPNAPYVLTDLIHLVEEIQRTESLLLNTLVIIPKYTLFVLLGFGAYVLSLVNVGVYLRQQGLERWVLPAEFGLHILSAIGVELGRFDRFNSWDLATHPRQVIIGTLQNFGDERSRLFMGASILAIAGLYWVGKQIVLALMLRYQSLSAERSKMGKDQKSAFNVSA